MQQKTSLLTRKQAAELLGLQPQTLAKWSMTGKNLPVIRLGSRSARYAIDDVMAFIARCTVQSSGTNGNNNIHESVEDAQTMDSTVKIDNTTHNRNTNTEGNSQS